MEERIVLFVDDEEEILNSFRRAFSDEPCKTFFAKNGEEALEILLHQEVHVVLLDIMMPRLNGYEICRRIKSDTNGELTQVILVSGKASVESRLKGYEVGADDYIVKPFDNNELLAKVKVQFRLRDALAKLASHNAELEEMVRQRTTQITETRDVTVFALAKLAESRDPETGEHLERLRAYSQILAEQLARQGPYTNEINEQFLENLYRSSPLHDIGKVGVPDTILLKPGQLSSDEFKIMKQHTLIGEETLKMAAEHSRSGGFLAMAIDIARAHHERFNGDGYPYGIAQQDIPLSARIVALVDVYDALTSIRVYKSAIKPIVAKSMIEQEEAKHFDPAIVNAFRICWDDFLNVQGFTYNGNPTLVESLVSDNVRR